MSREWELSFTLLGAPWTQNKVHNAHYRDVAKMRKHWRTTARDMAAGHRIPPLGCIHLEVTPQYPNRRHLPDTDAIAPTVKAVIDGLVDAGVIPDDSGREVLSVTYWAPVVIDGCASGMTVTIREDET